MTDARYFNRELSWLAFNERVLEEAEDPRIPLLSRLQFVAISASNLDEFFMVRVGGLQMLLARGRDRPDPSGMTPAQQFEAIAERTRRITRDQYACFDRLQAELAGAGIRRRRGGMGSDGQGGMSDRQAAALEEVFTSEIYPVMSPLAVDLASQPFPPLAGQQLNIAVRLEADPETGHPRFAVIPFGASTPRFITLPSDGGYEYMLVEDVVAMFIDRFFPGERLLEQAVFRVSRNADFSVREDRAADLLAQMEDVLEARRQSDCVRLEIGEGAGEALVDFLTEGLELPGAENRYILPGPLDLADFMELAELAGYDHLRVPPWPPQPAPAVDPAEPMFEVIARGDVLLYHPYESFDPVVRFVEEAAEDPEVLAIKQILYRTSRKSPIVAALARAAEQGKYVTAIVELKARFDEARNIEWARHLEQAGVQVLYGVKGLKTHAKICIVVRREPYGIQRYVHFGTGNYNESTARLYSDASLMTAHEEFGADATSFFHAITGYAQPQQFLRLEMAPIGLRDRLLEMIEVETDRAREGQPAALSAKINSLVDPKIIEALYAASEAGVSIRLNVRGICCLKPGVPGLSENITVISIVDRLLEHARIFHFHHAGDDRVYISSADWMPRNLDRRIELLVPVEDPGCRKQLIQILKTYFKDTAKARRLLPDGRYERVRPEKGHEPVRSQEVLYRRACEAAARGEPARHAAFIPYRAAEGGA